MNNSRFIKTLRHTWVMTLQAESIAPGSSTEVASVDFSYVCSRCGAKASYNYHVDKDGNPYDERHFMENPRDPGEWLHDELIEYLAKMKVYDYTCEAVLMDEALK